MIDKYLLIRFMNHELDSRVYFQEKYSLFTFAEALIMVQKDPEFKVTAKEISGNLEYRIELTNDLKNLN